ncbi:ORF2 [Amsterdam virus]|uniref:ORF2 n=1 Tax=Amsterdam virus TaxID=2613795 RepID=A0AAE6MXM1_9MONO|nr:ORF2 [Amsterdam virus]QEQ50494.1 ORF2 [Amsterdam virus]
MRLSAKELYESARSNQALRSLEELDTPLAAEDDQVLEISSAEKSLLESLKPDNLPPQVKELEKTAKNIVFETEVTTRFREALNMTGKKDKKSRTVRSHASHEQEAPETEMSRGSPLLTSTPGSRVGIGKRNKHNSNSEPTTEDSEDHHERTHLKMSPASRGKILRSLKQWCQMGLRTATVPLQVVVRDLSDKFESMYDLLTKNNDTTKELQQAVVGMLVKQDQIAAQLLKIGRDMEALKASQNSVLTQAGDILQHQADAVLEFHKKLEKTVSSIGEMVTDSMGQVQASMDELKFYVGSFDAHLAAMKHPEVQYTSHFQAEEVAGPTVAEAEVIQAPLESPKELTTETVLSQKLAALQALSNIDRIEAFEKLEGLAAAYCDSKYDEAIKIVDKYMASIEKKN